MLSSLSQAAELDTAGAIKRELELIRQEHQIPALAMAVLVNGELIFAGGAGFIDEEKTQAVDQNTLFRIASISKLFTAQAIMQLTEQGKIKLEDPISLYLDEFAAFDITIAELLSHSSGLSDQVRPAPQGSARSQSDYLMAVSSGIQAPLTTKSFAYSDTGFNLLGVIVHRVSGLTFEEYLRKNILKPAEMHSSGYFNGIEGTPPDTLPFYQQRLIPNKKRRPFDPAFYPSEGLVANVGDLANWLSKTLTHNPTLLSVASYQAMLAARVPTTWGNISLGLGWQVYVDNSQRVARHPGGIRGYRSLLIAYPDSNNAVILLTNASDVARFEIVTRLGDKFAELGLWN